MIGYMRPPASLLFLLISSNRSHSPVTSLVQEAQENQLESPSAQMKPKPCRPWLLVLSLVPNCG
jgi:hypothetical protein